MDCFFTRRSVCSCFAIGGNLDCGGYWQIPKQYMFCHMKAKHTIEQKLASSGLTQYAMAGRCKKLQLHNLYFNDSLCQCNAMKANIV